jgi:hypothetical protein
MYAENNIVLRSAETNLAPTYVDAVTHSLRVFRVEVKKRQMSKRRIG